MRNTRLVLYNTDTSDMNKSQSWPWLFWIF